MKILAFCYGWLLSEKGIKSNIYTYSRQLSNFLTVTLFINVGSLKNQGALGDPCHFVLKCFTARQLIVKIYWVLGGHKRSPMGPSTLWQTLFLNEAMNLMLHIIPFGSFCISYKCYRFWLDYQVKVQKDYLSIEKP